MIRNTFSEPKPDMTQAQEDFTNFQDHDSRKFDVWYENLDVQRLVWAMYQDVEQGIKAQYIPPFVFFDKEETRHVDAEIAICAEELKRTPGKYYYPFIFKPETGSAHYFAGIIRKDKKDDTITTFLFNPTANPRLVAQDENKEKARPILGGEPLIFSTHKVQTQEKDGGKIVSCGPICIEFMQYALNHPEWIDELDARFQLPRSLDELMKASIEHYQALVRGMRERDYQTLAKVTDDKLEEAYNFHDEKRDLIDTQLAARMSKLRTYHIETDDEFWEDDFEQDDLSGDEEDDDDVIEDTEAALPAEPLQLQQNSTGQAPDEKLQQQAKEREAAEKLQQQQAKEREAAENLQQQQAKERQAAEKLQQQQAKERQAAEKLQQQQAKEREAAEKLQQQQAKEREAAEKLQQQQAKEREAAEKLQQQQAKEREAAEKLQQQQAKEREAAEKLQQQQAKAQSRTLFEQKLIALDRKINHLNERMERLGKGSGQKYIDLENAYKAATKLRANLVQENDGLIENPTNEYYDNQFKPKCKEHFKNAHEVLDKHRGWSEFLINLALGIATAGLGLVVKGLVNLATNHSFFFVHQTQASKAVDETSEHVLSNPINPSQT